MTQGFVASCNEAYHDVWGKTERWRQFACIEYAKTSACASSHIEESAASFHSWFDGFHKGLNLRQNLAHSLSHQGIFLVDVLQYFAYRHLFQMIEERRLLSYLVF